MKKLINKIMIIVAAAAVMVIFIIIVTNAVVICRTGKRILKKNPKEKVDCIIVLGAGVKEDGTPSPMLEDRLIKAVELYEQGVSDRILMSGDHRSDYYDEVNVMKNYAIGKGIPSEDIFMDHAGLCTYDTMYRASAVFGIRNAVIVTQKYHLYRALYDAQKCGINAYGISADTRSYQGQTKRNIREAAARCKDVFACLLKVKPGYMGDSIDIHGNGNITNDR